MINLIKKTSIDDDFFDLNIEDYLESNQGSILFDLEGEISNRPIFISTLLHGNELSGLIALRQYLSNFRNKLLPRRLILLLGNIESAQKNIRKFDDEPDFNRIWNEQLISPDQNGKKTDTKNNKINNHRIAAKSIIDFVKSQNPILCLDIHNNTGKNPYYACVNKLDLDHIFLAKLFSSTIIYFTEPNEVMSVACSKFAPSLTIEAGKSRDRKGINLLLSFFKQVFALNSLCDFKEKQFEIFHTFAKMTVSKETSVRFEDNESAYECEKECDLIFNSKLDELNFELQKPGVSLGKCNDPLKKVQIVDANGKDVTDYFLDQSQKGIFLKHEFIPSMFTKDIKVIHQDCLGYLMEKCTIIKE